MNQNNLIVVYSRVSSAGQGLELQLSAARRYLESEGMTGSEDFILYLSDFDISASKLKMAKRPQLITLLNLLKEGRVTKIIGYKRDRFARNFYEHVDITKIFIKHEVDVIYTGSNEPPFKQKLSLEAIYGMFGQMEGQNIRARITDSQKQYPTRIFGYQRLKDETQTRYISDDTKEVFVVSLYDELNSVQNEEQFINFFIKKRKGFNHPERIIRILSNPFYAGHYEAKNGYQRLLYVEPMVPLDVFLECKNKLDAYLMHFLEKQSETTNQIIHSPLCGICGNPMKHRQNHILDVGSFVCSKHSKKNGIPVEEFNEVIQQAVLEYAQSLTINLSKRIITKSIVTENKRIQRDMKNANAKYLELALNVATFEGNTTQPSLLKSLEDMQNLKKKQIELEQDLLALKILSDETKSLHQLLKSDFTFSPYETKHLIRLLVDKVLVHDTHVSIHFFLSSFSKEQDVS